MDGCYLHIAPGAQIDKVSGVVWHEGHQFVVDPEWIAYLTEGCIDDLDNDDLLEFSRYGLCYIASPRYCCTHRSHLIAQLVTNVATEQKVISEHSFFQEIVRGSASRKQVIAWLLAMFSFTKSAIDHLGEAQAHASGAVDRKRWCNLLSEEQHHWKIYRNIFQECGLDIDILVHMPVEGAVREFVENLKSAARKSPYHYAALLYAIEQGPMHANLDEDPFFSCLIQHYGFSRRAVLPLFQHTVANETLGHSEIWFDVLKEKNWYSTEMAEDVVRHARHSVQLAGKWYEEVRHAV